MKKVDLKKADSKKISLRKTIVANLSKEELNSLVGGTSDYYCTSIHNPNCG